MSDTVRAREWAARFVKEQDTQKAATAQVWIVSLADKVDELREELRKIKSFIEKIDV